MTGRFYFTDGKSTVLYSKFKGDFHFYGYEGPTNGVLHDLVRAIPRLPVAASENRISYSDSISLRESHSFLARIAAYVRQSLLGRTYGPNAFYEFHPTRLEVKGRIEQVSLASRGETQTYAKLDPVRGFLSFRVGDRSYEVLA